MQCWEQINSITEALQLTCHQRLTNRDNKKIQYNRHQSKWYKINKKFRSTQQHQEKRFKEIQLGGKKHKDTHKVLGVSSAVTGAQRRRWRIELQTSATIKCKPRGHNERVRESLPSLFSPELFQWMSRRCAGADPILKREERKETQMSIQTIFTTS